MKVVFIKPVREWTPGLVYDLSIGDAEAYIRRGVARRATIADSASFVDTEQPNKLLKRKYVRRKGIVGLDPSMTVREEVDDGG